jgi:HD-GYP domain-containing protein (c-di-GMP phosphodiesterase class II)
VFTLGWSPDLRSPSRAGHLPAVANMSAPAGPRCGLSDEDVSTLRHAALITISAWMAYPPQILGKPGPLTATIRSRADDHKARAISTP